MTEPTDTSTLTELVAVTIAGALGLGDEALVTDEWPVEDGDTVLWAEVGGDATGKIALAVNDDVAGRLMGDTGPLTEALVAATAALAEQLGLQLTVGAAAPGPSTAPSSIAGILDAGQLTAVAGLDLLLPAAPDGDERALGEELDRGAYRPVDFDSESFEAAIVSGTLSVLQDVDMVVTAELGRTTMPMRELLGLSPGMVVEIDRAAGAPIDLLVNGRRIATGEVVVIDEEFGIRITEISPAGEPTR